MRGELLYIGAGSVAVQAMMGGEVEVVAGAGNAVVSAILQGVAVIKTRKEFGVNVMRKYLRKTEVENSCEYAARYLERVPRVDPTAIQTVLASEGKSDIAPTRFYDNAIIDRLAQEGFIDNLCKGGL